MDFFWPSLRGTFRGIDRSCVSLSFLHCSQLRVATTCRRRNVRWSIPTRRRSRPSRDLNWSLPRRTPRDHQDSSESIRDRSTTRRSCRPSRRVPQASLSTTIRCPCRPQSSLELQRNEAPSSSDSPSRKADPFSFPAAKASAPATGNRSAAELHRARVVRHSGAATSPSVCHAAALG